MSEFVVYLIDHTGRFETLVTPLLEVLGGRLVVCESDHPIATEDRDHASCVIINVEDLSQSSAPSFQLETLTPFQGLLDSLPKIVVFPSTDTKDAVEWMRVGAAAVIDSASSPEHWSRIISEVVNADRKVLRDNATLLKTCQRYYSLTPRQRKIVGHLLDGKQNKWIAATLDVSKRTVELDRASILQSMNVENSIQLAAAITEMRLIGQVHPRLMFQVRNNRIDQGKSDPPYPQGSREGPSTQNSSARTLA